MSMYVFLVKKNTFLTIPHLIWHSYWQQQHTMFWNYFRVSIIFDLTVYLRNRYHFHITRAWKKCRNISWKDFSKLKIFLHNWFQVNLLPLLLKWPPKGQGVIQKLRCQEEVGGWFVKIPCLVMWTKGGYCLKCPHLSTRGG